MICENPMLEDNRTFIIHTRQPYILAEAHHFGTFDENLVMECKRQYPVGGITELPNEIIVLGAIDVMVVENFTNEDYAGIMRRMADWYRAYCEWEDNQIDNLDTGN